MFQRLRIVASYLYFALCVAFVAYWVRSYSPYAFFDVQFPAGGTLEIMHWQGKLLVIWNKTPGNLEITEWHVGYQPADMLNEEFRADVNQSPLSPSKAYGFGIGADSYSWNASAPYWFLVVLSGALAIFFKPKPRLQFSVRGLLILTTIVALMLGGIMALVRT